MLCPDLATARYLAVFARLGVKLIAIPYDITKISQFADELESSWHRMFLLVDELSRDEDIRPPHGALVKRVRDEILAAGAGAPVPEFARTTKQRR